MANAMHLSQPAAARSSSTRLVSADGPFKGCKADAHGERLKPLPLIAPPDNRTMPRQLWNFAVTIRG
jgi:hypothetical protein